METTVKGGLGYKMRQIENAIAIMPEITPTFKGLLLKYYRCGKVVNRMGLPVKDRSAFYRWLERNRLLLYQIETSKGLVITSPQDAFKFCLAETVKTIQDLNEQKPSPKTSLAKVAALKLLADITGASRLADRALEQTESTDNAGISSLTTEELRRIANAVRLDSNTAPSRDNSDGASDPELSTATESDDTELAESIEAVDIEPHERNEA